MSKDWSYRVWDKQEKTYSDKAFSIDQYGIPYVQYEDGYWEEASARYVFEFSTGLKDRNGKMIREGDIVRLYDGKYGNYIVNFSEHNFAFVFDAIDGSHMYWFSRGKSEDAEVIGNIHEAPKDFRPEHLKRMGVSISKGGKK